LPFKRLLKELVSSVEGAEGAILIEGDGEAVQWWAEGDGERLQLRGAYVAVMIQACRAQAARSKLGATKNFTFEYDGARLVVEELGWGYFVLVELAPSTNLGKAVYLIRPALESLRREISA
jgi:predicted regulator of Ras-like GTPase activity (Roadblock/LC7/MglB family)